MTQYLQKTVCRDLGFAPAGGWITEMYWHRNPDVIAQARRPYYWTYYAPDPWTQACTSGPYSYYYEVARADGWGCPDATWAARTDSAGNQFCYRPRNLLCTGKSPSSSFGNPIDCIPGGKRESEVDYRGAGVNPLEFAREYDSQRTTPAFPGNYAATPLGSGWRTKYDRRIDTRAFNGITTIVLTREDGGLRYFKLNGSTITSTAEEQGKLQQNGTAWRYTSSNDAVEDYDPSGRLISITDRGGATLALAYDTLGRLTSVSDAIGRQLTFSYDATGHIQTMTDPSGGTYAYGYDASNNLTSVTYPDQRIRRYLYNEFNLTSGTALLNALTGIIDENGTRYASFSYDGTGRAIQTTHHSGLSQTVNQYSIAYSSNTQRAVTDPLGKIRTYSIETVGGVSRITAASASCVGCASALIASVTYDANSNVSSGVDFRGTRVCYAYDLTRNLETTRVEGLLSTESCTTALVTPPSRPDVRKTTTAWHATYRLPASITEPAAGGTRTTTFTYDNSGNLTQKVIAAPKNDGTGATTTRTWSWTYTTRGRLLTATDPNGKVTTYAYYADAHSDFGKRGNLASITNPLGHVTEITAYDANARPRTVVDPNGITTTLTYDSRGRLASRSVGGETTSYTYDGIGQLTRVTSPDGSFLAYTYDGAHRLTQIADGLGNKIVFTLDAMGNRTQEQAFDPGNYLERARSRIYDAWNQLKQDLGALGQSTTYTYDPNNNLATITDPLTRVTANTYDALNRLTKVLDPGNGTTRYEYDPANNLTQVTDPRNNATAYTFDGLDNPTKVSSPDTGITTSTFDAAGNLVTKADARGVTAIYTYDALNRVAQVVYGKTGTTSETHTFGYDSGANAKGKLTQVMNAAATTTWTYTSQGRVASKTQQVGTTNHTITYGYNGAGQLTALTTASGQVIGYSYVNNRVSGITVNGQNLVTNVGTTPFGPVSSWRWANGLYTFRDYDTDGRLATWEFRNGVSLLRKDRSFDAASRVVAVNDPNSPAVNQSYQYDVLDRLTTAQIGNPVTNTQQFTYDGVGNRVNATIDGILTNYTYPGTSNRLSALTGATSRSYSYDGAGNPIAIGGQSYTYNNANRLVAIQSGGTTSASYGLNALGQRVSKVVSGTTTLFAYDEQGHLLGEYDGSGNLIQETVWLEDLPVATLRPNGTGNPVPIAIYYVHADHLGSPRAVTRPSDNVTVWRWGYRDAFGANLANENPSGEGTFKYALRFPGQYFDAETGTHYNYFRDYDPIIGRYEQSDPIGLAGGVNTYAYVFGNPLGRIDPIGLDAYQCVRPLGGRPGQYLSPGNVTHHQYSCISLPGGAFRCGGQGPSGSPFGSPGRPTTPEEDYFHPDACRKTQDDKPCFENCLQAEWDKPRPRYSIVWGLGVQCQEYDDDVNRRCRARCNLK